MNKVTLFGEEITLVRPAGRKGVMYMQQALKAWKRALEAVESVQGVTFDAGGNPTIGDAAAISTLVSDYIDDNFLDNVLPGIFEYSEQHLSTKQALAKIDKWEVSLEGLAEIFQAFMSAMTYWSAPEDQEALDEAVKKSPDAGVEAEAEEKVETT